MKPRRASSTAQMVALWRALAHGGATSVPAFHDPYAAAFLRGGFRLAHAVSQRGFAALPAAQRAKAAEGFDAIPIRVAVIDRLLLDAVGAGCGQVVMLGAGFDTRAWRLPGLTGTTVFEVDHPATQAAKRPRAEALPSPHSALRWVPVDFTRDSLSVRLAEAGHRAEQPTAWVWEGVVMYLEDEALRQSLEAVRARSAEGSRLILHYHEPSGRALERLGRRLAFSTLSEPQLGLRSRLAMAGFLARARFGVEVDLGIDAQAELVGARAPRGGVAEISRVLLARPASR